MKDHDQPRMNIQNVPVVPDESDEPAEEIRTELRMARERLAQLEAREKNPSGPAMMPSNEVCHPRHRRLDAEQLSRLIDRLERDLEDITSGIDRENLASVDETDTSPGDGVQ